MQIRNALSKLFRLNKIRKKRIVISRVSDLLAAGMDPHFLAKEFVRLDREVWQGKITDNPLFLRTEEIVLQNFRHCAEIIYCAFEDRVLTGTLTNMYLKKEQILDATSWYTKTGGGTLSTQTKNRETGFGVDLTVAKTASRGVSDRLVLTALIVSLIGGGLKSVYLGSRIPGYHRHSHLSPAFYVFGKRRSGKPLDPELYFYLKNGFEIAGIIPNYMDDPQSLDYGVIVRWDNPLYKITKIIPPLRYIVRRLGEKFLLGLPPNIK